MAMRPHLSCSSHFSPMCMCAVNGDVIGITSMGILAVKAFGYGVVTDIFPSDGAVSHSSLLSLFPPFDLRTRSDGAYCLMSTNCLLLLWPVNHRCGPGISRQCCVRRHKHGGGGDK